MAKFSSVTARLVVGVVFVNLSVYSLIGISQHHFRQEHEEQAKFLTENLARLLSVSITGIINKVDIALLSVIHEAEGQFAEGGLNDEKMNRYLVRLHAQLPELEGIWMTDAAGNIRYGAVLPAGQKENIGDRDHFRRQHEHDNQGLVVSKSMQSWITGMKMVHFSRRVNRADGSFAGIVCGAISLAYFTELSSSHDIGTDSVMALLDHELAMITKLSRAQGSGDPISNSRERTRVIGLLKTHPDNGSYLADAGQAISYYKIDNCPFYVFVGQEMTGNSYHWRKKLNVDFLLATIFTLSTLVFAHVSYRRRQSEEQAMEEMRASKKRFQDLLELQPVPVAITEGSVGVYFNKKFIETFGYTLAEMPTLDCWMNTVHPDPDYRRFVIDTYGNDVGQAIESDVTIPGREYRVTCKDGSDKYLIVSGKMIGRQFVNILLDITDRRRVEEELAKSSIFLRTLVDTIPDLVWLKDPDGVYLGCNRIFEQFFGAAAAEIVGKTDYDFVDKELADSFREHDRKAMAAGKPSANEELVSFAVDGRQVLMETTKMAMYDANGALLGVLGISHDITKRKLAEEMVRYERDRAQGYLDTIETMLVALDVDGRITTINRKACQIFGFRENELVGQFWFTSCLPQPEGKEKIYPLYQQLIAGELIPFEYVENSIVTRKGELRQVAWHNVILRDEQGGITGMLSAGEDITERKQRDDIREARLRLLEFSVAHSSSELLQRALDEIEAMTCSTIGFCHYLDSDQKTLTLQAWSTNTINTMCRITGKGHRYDLAMAGVWADCVRERQPVIHNDYASLLHRQGLPDGHAPVFREIVVPIFRDNQIVAILGVGNKPQDYTYIDLDTMSLLADLAWDIAERKQVEEELDRHRFHLEKQVDSRTAELVVARDAAESANRAKNVFLANMSHEIRTPMNAVLGFAQLLAVDTSLSPAARDKVATVTKSGEHLLELINNILEMSRIDAGQAVLQTQSVDLNSIVDDVAAMIRLQAERKGLDFILDKGAERPPFILADPTKLRQILINLLVNAVKFTQKGTILLRVIPSAANRIAIEVRDTGIGISCGDQEKIFQPFVRTLSGEQVSEGTGLGLAISREFAHLMGGEITLESCVGEGSSFRFEFPAPVSGELPRADEDIWQTCRLASAQENLRVLVVDDMEVNRDLFRALLEPLGFVVDEACDGLEALEKARTVTPHIILMDLVMPNMDGVETTQVLRNSGSLNDSCVIIGVSANIVAQGKSLIESGCNAFVAKPVRVRELYDVLALHAGLSFEYAEIGSAAPSEVLATLGPESFLTLSPEIRRELGEALLNLDVARITELINRIGTENPVLADVLRHYANRFDYSGILDAMTVE